MFMWVKYEQSYIISGPVHSTDDLNDKKPLWNEMEHHIDQLVVSDMCPWGHWFKTNPQYIVVSLRKTIDLLFLVLVQPRKQKYPNMTKQYLTGT